MNYSSQQPLALNTSFSEYAPPTRQPTSSLVGKSVTSSTSSKAFSSILMGVAVGFLIYIVMKHPDSSGWRKVTEKCGSAIANVASVRQKVGAAYDMSSNNPCMNEDGVEIKNEARCCGGPGMCEKSWEGALTSSESVKQKISNSGSSGVTIVFKYKGCGHCNMMCNAYHCARNMVKKPIHCVEASTMSGKDMGVDVKYFPYIAKFKNGALVSEFSGERSGVRLASFANE